MNVRKMTDLDLSGQRVLIREDLNVPVKHGKVTSDARLRASLPTIQAALEAGAKVLLMSHLGRPTEGEPAEEFSWPRWPITWASCSAARCAWSRTIWTAGSR